jgi:hypothetical protein
VTVGAADVAAACGRFGLVLEELLPTGRGSVFVAHARDRDEILEQARTRGGGVWVPFRNASSSPAPGVPLSSLTDRLRLGSPAAARLPRTFVYCSSPPAPMIGPSAERARTEPGWCYRELACGHIVQHEKPGELVDVLLGTV